MSLTRRHFLGASAALGAAAALPLPDASAAPPATSLPPLQIDPPATLDAPLALPPFEVIALNRMAYGPRPDDLARVRALGLPAYIEEQLNPAAIDDSACDTQIAAVSRWVEHLNAFRPLELIGSTTQPLWPTHLSGMVNFSEKMRPWEEVRVATLIRALLSRRQLQEVLVDFWHNHFNVYHGFDTAIVAGWPDYDRIMRRNCLGNFRVFLGEITRSTAMMYYLDNVSNRAAGGEGGNENFARELFELITLGSDNYLKFYDDRRQIGTITYNNETFARGYIDDDVYEAADCFTGWSIANNHWSRSDDPDPNDGSFYYDPNWHVTGTKTVLSPDGYPNIRRNQPPLQDGEDVLDLVARHPGTARNLCTKLCRRLISDNPPSTVVDAAVAEWMAHRDSSDQIARVVRVILNASEFRTTWGQKVKRPFELVCAYLRAVNAVLPNDTANPNSDSYWTNLFWNIGNSGHRLFEWPTPTGYPDLATFWMSTNGMLRRWNLLSYLGNRAGWGGGFTIDLVAQTIMNSSCTQIVDFWITRLCGYPITPTTRQQLIDFLAQTTNGGNPANPPAPATGEWAPDEQRRQEILRDRLEATVWMLAMSPDYQVR